MNPRFINVVVQRNTSIRHFGVTCFLVSVNFIDKAVTFGNPMKLNCLSELIPSVPYKVAFMTRTSKTAEIKMYTPWLVIKFLLNVMSTT